MVDLEKLTYRVKELIAVTGLSKSTIYRLMNSGELPSFRLHTMRLVLKSDLDSWLAGAAASPPQTDE